MQSSSVRVLLIDDDPDDCAITGSLLREIPGTHTLEFCGTYAEGLTAIHTGQHDVCLLDYRLGASDGLDLLRDASRAGSQIPIILLTGQGDTKVEHAALAAGASDYLVKGSIDADRLERSIRHSVERHETLRIGRVAEARYRRIVETANEGIWLLDIFDRTVFANRRMAELLGYEPEAMVGRSMLDFVPPSGRVAALEGLDRRRRGEVEQSEFSFLREDGTELWVIASLSPVHDEQGRFAGSLAMVSDITGRRKIEQDLKETQQFLEQAQRVGHSGSWVWQIWEGKLRWSAEIYRILGVASGALGTMKKFLDLVHRDDLTRVRQALAYARGGAGEYDIEHRIIRPDGEVRWMQNRATLTHRPGESDALVGILQDVTERVKGEATLRRLASVVESTDDGVMSASLDGIIIDWNRGAERLYGYTAAEAVGMNLRLVVPPDRWDELQGLLNQIAEGKSIRNFETVRVRKDGTRVEVALTLSPVVDASGKVVGKSTIMRDITEAKRLQVKMTSTDRLATVGTLAAGVAHEINNPLACVLANLSYALSILGDLPLEVRGSLEETVDALQGARDGAERIRQTCRDIKLFSGGAGDEESGPTEVGPVLESALAMAASETRHRAKVVRNLEPVPTVDIGQNRLGQVLLNLILNAAQAIPDGLPAENEIHVSTQVRGRRVVIAIRDTGCGMTPIVRARIFEPFYTTKAVGTGLGLSICKGIIEKLGGQIEVESAVGAGTTFRVILPIGKL